MNLRDGALSDSSRLFNRAAYVGLSGQFRTVFVGRQANVIFDLMGAAYEPFTVANYNQTAWMQYALTAGLLADNARKYFQNIFRPFRRGNVFNWRRQTPPSRTDFPGKFQDKWVRGPNMLPALLMQQGHLVLRQHINRPEVIRAINRRRLTSTRPIILTKQLSYLLCSFI